MTEGLDQIEAQQSQNTANIADLIALSGDVLQAAQLNTTTIAQLTAKIDKSNRRFGVLKQKVIADRQRYDERFDQMLLEIRGVSGRVDNLEQAS